MVASLNVKTPAMEVPILRSSSALCKAKRLQRRWSRLLFCQVLANLNVHEKLTLKLNDHKRTYTIEFHFDEKYGKKQLNEIIRSFEIYFIPRLCRAINKNRKELTTSDLLRSAHIRDKITINDSNDKDDQQEPAEKDDDEDDEQVNGDANTAKEKAHRNDEKEYDDEDIGENETDDEEAMQDNQDEDEQPNGSKITIKEDIIDDDNDLQDK